MLIYDLCVAWDWQYDADFIRLLELSSQKHGLSLLQVTLENLEKILLSLAQDEISFRTILDRASDSDERFIPLVAWAQQHSVYSLNPYNLARLAWDKANCHVNFSRSGLPTPNTVILPSREEASALDPIDLGLFSSGFSIKPAHGGGGRGVITQATTWEQVEKAREEFPSDQFLLQAYIVPAVLDSRQAWFRVLYCAGQVFPCWWDTQTHIYTPLYPHEEDYYYLESLKDISFTIAGMCKLGLFSSEIARMPSGNFVIVDYVNDPIDLRLQSYVREGVPDTIVASIAERIACHILSRQ